MATGVAGIAVQIDDQGVPHRKANTAASFLSPYGIPPALSFLSPASFFFFFFFFTGTVLSTYQHSIVSPKLQNKTSLNTSLLSHFFSSFQNKIPQESYFCLLSNSAPLILSSVLCCDLAPTSTETASVWSPMTSCQIK